MTEENLKNLAKQLRKPEGEAGLELATLMHETNIQMTLEAIEQLNLTATEAFQILEIGPAQAKHLTTVLAKSPNSTYTGIEISTLMKESACAFNQGFVDSKKADFLLYDGENIPFESDSFDRIFTVNTLYFWKNPAYFLGEIERVLKPTGIFSISFGDESYMKNLPFTEFGFTLYSFEKMEQLVADSKLEIVQQKQVEDEIRSKTGEQMTRKFHCLSLRKRIASF